MKLIFNIITLFPEVVSAYVNSSILKRAQDSKLLEINFFNPRDFSDQKGQRVDDRPFGGGPGMVIEALPVVRAWQKAKGKSRNIKTVFFTPAGRKFSNNLAQEWLYSEKIKEMKYILICGRYEGIDARVIEITNAELVSVGDYTLTGGEIPAMILIDTLSRRVEGVLGSIESIEENRTAGSFVYTRPETFRWKNKNWTVPEILRSGNHKNIENWKKNINENLRNKNLE